MKWVYDDGGRTEAGFKGEAGDCVCRAISIVTEKPYKEVYDLINEFAKKERIGKRKMKKSSARTGVYKPTIRKVMTHLGYKWIPTMHIGSGCTVHLNADELPSGRIVVNVSHHTTAVIDGVIHDTYDPNDRGCWIDYVDGVPVPRENTDRCVYGYYIKEGA